jgi:hypothetical protein
VSILQVCGVYCSIARLVYDSCTAVATCAQLRNAHTPCVCCSMVQLLGARRVLVSASHLCRLLHGSNLILQFIELVQGITLCASGGVGQ